MGILLIVCRHSDDLTVESVISRWGMNEFDFAPVCVKLTVNFSFCFGNT